MSLQLTACSLLLALASPPQAPAARAPAAAPVPDLERIATRVLPLGDSITQGGQGFASWRYPLWFSLAPLHDVDFVGSRSIVFGGDVPGNPDVARYPLYYSSFDRDHEGWWGIRTDQIDALAHSAALAARPDIVLVHLGTNDIGQFGASGVSNALANLPRILDHVRAVNPAARFFVAQLVPIGPGTGYFNNAALVDTYNQQLASLAPSWSTSASRVRVVDQNTGFDVATMMQSDGLHPNVLGEDRIAGIWLQALNASWVEPLPPTHRAVALADTGFESPALGDGGILEAPSGSAWRFGATSSAARGFWNPPESSYPGASGNGTPLGADGAQVLYLYNGGGASESAVAFQTLPTTLERGRTYTLTVAVGQRLATSGWSYGGFEVELLAGGERLAIARDTFVPSAGAFQDVTLSFGPVEANAPVAGGLERALGRALTIRLRITSSTPNSATDFDRVRLVAQ